MHQKIILASASPRRKELLKQMKLNFKVQKIEVDESSSKQKPFAVVKDIVQKKSKVANEFFNLSKMNETSIICADTIVAHQNKILGKPQSKKNAFEMLKQLSGQRHKVFTAFTISCSNGQSYLELVKTEVEFMDLSKSMIEAYLKHDEYKDKAGAYAIQGMAGSFVKSINGSYTNVVGLPQVELFMALKKLKVISV